MKRMLVLGLIGAVGLACLSMATTLSGSWNTDVIIDPQQTNFNSAIGLLSVLTVSYSVDVWTFTSVSDLDEGGWTDQDFVVVGILGPFTLASEVDFDPSLAIFGSWKSTASVALAGVGFTADFTLYDNDVTLVLTGSGVTGDVTIGAELTFGGDDNDICDLKWADLKISLGLPVLCTVLEAAVLFDCQGFDNIVLTATDIAIPNLPFVTIDATIKFTPQTKSLTLSPRISVGVVTCFDLYLELASTPGVGPVSPLILDGITFNGIGIIADIGMVTFTALSFWGDGTKPGLLYKTPYWEVYAVSSNEDACCGPFGFDAAVYFLEAGTMLFDIALIDVDVTLQMAPQFTFRMGLKIDVEIGAFTEWLIGFNVTW